MGISDQGFDEDLKYLTSIALMKDGSFAAIPAPTISAFGTNYIAGGSGIKMIAPPGAAVDVQGTYVVNSAGQVFYWGY